MITIVSSDVCPYCSAAKQLLTSLGYEYEEKRVDM
jgi:glutaredoxin